MKKLVAFLVQLFIIVGSLSAASVTVTKPAANETWIKGQSFAIIWTKSGTMPDKVRITLRNKASTTVVQEIVDGAPNSGTYTWPVPASIPDGEYRIRVKVKNADIYDDSEVFNISTSQQPKSPLLKKAKATATKTPYSIPIKPYLKVVRPAENDTCRNGQHLYIHFDAFTMPGDAIEISFYNESGTKKIYDVYDGTYGEGTSVPPSGPDYPRRYYYDWIVPFGDLFSPGYYKIRVHSVGKNLTAWSGRVYITWPMEEGEYYLVPVIVNLLCVNNSTGLSPWPNRPNCTDLYYPDHARVGFDIFDYPGSITWTDGEVHTVWRLFMSHAQLKFPIEQFQGKKVKLLQAKLLLKKECTTTINSNLASSAGRLYRLEAPPSDTGWNACVGTQKTALMILPSDLTEKSIYVNQTVEYWINKTIPNYGFLLTVAEENPIGAVSATTCKSQYTAKLYVKIEEEYKGYH